jgi:signal transduction histidine kinase
LLQSSDYNQGVSFLNINRDSAFYYFNKAVNSSKDSLQIAVSYNWMAVIQSDAGDYFGSQQSALNSLNFLNEQRRINYSCLASDYNELANTSLNLKNFDAALVYNDKALKFEERPEYIPTLLNNKATAYQKKGDYGKAIEIYRSVLDKSKLDTIGYARILSNLAITRWLQDPAFQASPDLMAALRFREDKKWDWGILTSYDHLSDFYFNSYSDSALIYSFKMYHVALKLGNPDDQLEALQKLIKLAPAQDSKRYTIRYLYLNDSLQTARNAAKNQFALIRYDSEKNRTDNLVLQMDNSEKRIQIFKQRLALYGVLILIVLLFILAVIWFRKRRQRMLLESQNLIREQQLKTSQKVHDVVANGLYSIITSIEHQEMVEKPVLLNKLENLYERSRDLSYELPETIRGDFEESIANLVMSFGKSPTKVVVAGNNKNLWDDVKENIRKEVEHVLQELMINMRKHSKAQNVGVRFDRKENTIFIQYTDDGIGLPSPFFLGNGLTNTGNRIKSMGGEIIFDPDVKKGLRILISFPID